MDDRSSIEIFLNHCAIERGLAKNTLTSYRRDLEKFLSYLNQNQKTLSSITPSDVAAFLHTLREANLNESSIARNAVALRSLYAFIAKESGVESIAKEILVPRSAKRLPKALSIDQIATL
ncbi:MAG: site-specific tyrosine recombinase XerD, partial [Actinobacteria bacterium]|nr:site-specific tyrosine recombinase XerD [Actinomycetota bacterium]